MSEGILAIDPGLRGCGAAFGFLGQICAASYVQGVKDPAVRREGLWHPMVKAVWDWAITHGTSPCGLVIELPQVYKAAHQRGKKVGTDPQDLIKLAAVVGGFVCLFRSSNQEVRTYLPAEWKGQVPKNIVHDRARARLSPTELAVVQKGLPRASLAHNVWDAVSLYLRHVGRL